MDLSHGIGPSISMLSGVVASRCQVWFGFHHSSLQLFPEGTNGFLYYHLPKHAQEISGEVRFRVCTTNDPSKFSAGHDLLAPSRLPWRVPLLCVSNQKIYSGLAGMLIQDGLISRTSIERYKELQGVAQIGPQSQVLYHRDDLFLVNFDQSYKVNFISENGFSRLQFYGWCDTRPGYDTRPGRGTSRYFPYEGASFCRYFMSCSPSVKLYELFCPARFELAHRKQFFSDCEPPLLLGSALCRLEEHGANDVVMRVVKILKEVRLADPRYDRRIPPPAEGELRMKLGKPWMISSRQRAAFLTLPASKPTGPE